MMPNSTIGKANGVNDMRKLIAKSEGSLRRAYHEIKKLKNKANE